MNIYLHEMKALRKPTVTWTLAMIFLVVLYFSIYKGIVKDIADFQNLLAGYPEGVRAALGISLENLASVLGFYSMVFSFITLCGALQAMNYGLSILSKEARERTADFLLVKPVTRNAIVSAKLLAAITMLLVTNAVYYAAAFITANIVKTENFSNKLFFLVSLTLLFIQLIFFALGMFLSVFFQKLKNVLPVSLGVVFGFYILGAILVTDENDKTRFFAPFKYFNFSYILKNAGYETLYLITGALIVAAAIAATYLIYIKKDIHAVS